MNWLTKLPAARSDKHLLSNAEVIDIGRIPTLQQRFQLVSQST